MAHTFTYPRDVKTVYYFGTCLVDMSFPQAGMAGMHLLRRAGVEVVFPQEQSCCGQPAYNSGFLEEAKAVARAQIKAFSRADWPIVVPSGSCAGMMRHHYPEMFANDPEYFDVRKFSERVFELGDFLHNALHVQYKDKGKPVKVTWHSSCHAMREMGATAAAKALIGQLSNVELVEIEREYECCGFGGTFSIKQPEISAAMVADKVEDIRATGASAILSGDCGCLMNIGGAMEHKGVPVTPRHLAEFIWERING